MKSTLSFLALIISGLACCQEINLKSDFNWANIEKENQAIIEKFIKLTPHDFEIYRLNEAYTPTMTDLINNLHVVDLNNDGLDDIVFDGLSGGEPRQITIYMNTGTTFDKVLDEYQEITRLEFSNRILSRLFFETKVVVQNL